MIRLSKFLGLRVVTCWGGALSTPAWGGWYILHMVKSLESRHSNNSSSLVVPSLGEGGETQLFSMLAQLYYSFMLMFAQWRWIHMRHGLQVQSVLVRPCRFRAYTAGVLPDVPRL